MIKLWDRRGGLPPGAERTPFELVTITDVVFDVVPHLCLVVLFERRSPTLVEQLPPFKILLGEELRC